MFCVTFFFKLTNNFNAGIIRLLSLTLEALPMSLSRKTLNTLIAGAFAVTLAGPTTSFAQDNASATEKCYGVVKAGKNDCASADGRHSCGGKATVDNDGGEYIALPKGVCEKLVSGSLTPFEGAAKTR